MASEEVVGGEGVGSMISLERKGLEGGCCLLPSLKKKEKKEDYQVAAMEINFTI